MPRKQPEEHYIVTVDGDAVRCTLPNGKVETISLTRLSDVYVETNDSGPWGLDVWLVLRDDLDQQCAFPLGAVGYEAALDRLRQIPGFLLDGMNSTANARFLCWQREA